MLDPDTPLPLDRAAALAFPEGGVRRRWESDIDKLVSCEDSFHHYFETWLRSGRGRARKRGHTFNVDADYLTNLVIEQNYRCAVSGLEFEMKLSRRHPFSASVDRIHNDRGYERGNVRVVCLIVNLARSNFGDDALLRMCNAISAGH